MLPEEFGFGTGKVIHWGLKDFDSSIPVDNQLDDLHEDLIQVHFGENVILDAGWYPACASDGCFVIVLVRNEDWETPIFREECNDLQAFRAILARGVQAAEKMHD